MLLHVAVDRGLKVDDAEEGAALESALGEGREEALDCVEPGSAGWGEVESDPGWRASQAITFGCLWAA